MGQTRRFGPFFFWRERASRRADLNRWPADYESAALPTELRRQKNAHPNGVSSSRKEKRIVESANAGSSSSGPNLNRGLGVVNELFSRLFKAFSPLRLTDASKWRSATRESLS